MLRPSYASSLFELDLTSMLEGDAGMYVMCSAIEKGVLDNLETLRLSRNCITDSGMRAFSRALVQQPLLLPQSDRFSGGSNDCYRSPEDIESAHARMPSLTWLYLSINLISDEGICAFADAIAAGALANLVECRIYENQVGHHGMRALADALLKPTAHCPHGALPSIRCLYLGWNPGSDWPVQQALAERRRAQAPPSLSTGRASLLSLKRSLAWLAPARSFAVDLAWRRARGGAKSERERSHSNVSQNAKSSSSAKSGGTATVSSAKSGWLRPIHIHQTIHGSQRSFVNLTAKHLEQTGARSTAEEHEARATDSTGRRTSLMTAEL